MLNLKTNESNKHLTLVIYVFALVNHREKSSVFEPLSFLDICHPFRQPVYNVAAIQIRAANIILKILNNPVFVLAYYKLLFYYAG